MSQDSLYLSLSPGDPGGRGGSRVLTSSAMTEHIHLLHQHPFLALDGNVGDFVGTLKSFLFV